MEKPKIKKRGMFGWPAEKLKRLAKGGPGIKPQTRAYAKAALAARTKV